MLDQIAIHIVSKCLSRKLNKWSFLQESFSFSHINTALDTEVLCIGESKMFTGSERWKLESCIGWAEVSPPLEIYPESTATGKIWRMQLVMLHSCWCLHRGENEETQWDWPTMGYNAGLPCIGSISTEALPVTFSLVTPALAQNMNKHPIDLLNWGMNKWTVLPFFSFINPLLWARSVDLCTFIYLFF